MSFIRGIDMNKKTWIVQGIMVPGLLVIALLASAFFSLSSIENLQGNARVINYTGIVRGATQRLVKLELNEQPNDKLIQHLDGILRELQTGKGDNHLIKLPDKAYQKQLKKMQEAWVSLKTEIRKVRSHGDEQALFALSEHYFEMADQAVKLAEDYTEYSVDYAQQSLYFVAGIFILLSIIGCIYLITQRIRGKKLLEAEHENRVKSEYLSKMYQAFRAPLEEISEVAYISDTDNYDLLYLNEAGRKSFNADTIKGKKCYEVLQNRTSPCPFCTTAKLEVGVNYTWEYTNPITHRHYLLKDRLIEWEGKTARMEIAFDTTESENERLNLQNSLEAQRVLMDCVHALYEEQDINKAIKYVLGQVGSYLKAERAYIFEIGDKIFYNTHEWCSDGISAQLDNLQAMPISIVERWMRIFQKRECVILNDINDIKADYPDEYKVLVAQGIHVLVAAPLEHEGKVTGFIGIDNPPPERIKNIVSFLHTLRFFIMLAIRRSVSEHMLSNLSYHDMLTSFYNRNRYIQDLENLSTHEGPLGVVFLDLNGLKETNDHFGHVRGDEMLKKCAEHIRIVFQQSLFYRIGGDEFVILNQLMNEQDFFTSVRKLKQRFKNDPNCHAAIGSKWVAHIEDIQHVVADADADMYLDKKAYYRENPKTNRYRHHNDEILPLGDPKILKDKIDQRQFVVYLQPKVSSDNRTAIGAEALIRYQPKKDSLILPGNFLPLLEEMQEISQIDFFVFDYVCSKIKEWSDQGKKLMPISVNFSRCSLQEPAFIERLIEICDKHDVPRKYLEIEITEDIRGAVGIDIKDLVARIRNAGFIVSIDDFGTEYANLSLLTSIEFDILKLDKSLIDDIVTNDKSKAIIEAIANYCERMKITLIAEGIESEDQLEVLKACGVEFAQGFLFSKPVPIEQYEQRYLNNVRNES